jgi:radical SAM modification target selenobiotic family peptide
MDGKELKKVLASLGIATLVTAVGAMVPGHLQAGSGWGGKTDGTVGADKAASSGTSGCSGEKAAALKKEVCTEKMTEEECAKAMEEKAKAAEEAEKKASGGSGWGGKK